MDKIYLVPDFASGCEVAQIGKLFNFTGIW